MEVHVFSMTSAWIYIICMQVCNVIYFFFHTHKVITILWADKVYIYIYIYIYMCVCVCVCVCETLCVGIYFVETKATHWGNLLSGN